MLATVEDLADYLQDPSILTDHDEYTAAAKVLAFASGEIRTETRQHFSVVTDDAVELTGTWDRRLRLPQRPVTAVATVATTDPGGTTTTLTAGSDYRWLRNGTLIRLSGSIYRLGRASSVDWGGELATVTVTYSHGYDPIPDYIVGLTCALAARGWTNPAGVIQQTVGTFSESYMRSVGVTLTPHERKTLSRWTRRS